MIRTIWQAAIVLLAFGASLGAQDKAPGVAPQAANGKATANASFDKLKKLAGTWVAADDQGKPTDKIMSIFKLTAGGSALQETLFPGGNEEMVSVYHLDGSDLVMTHY